MIVAAVATLVIAVVWVIASGTADQNDETARGTPSATADSTERPSATHSPEAEAVLEYFQQLYRVHGEATELASETLSTPRPTLPPDATLDDYRATILKGIRLAVPVYQAFVDGMEDIDPPPQVADAHEELLDAYRQAVTGSVGIIEVIEVVSTRTDIDFTFQAYNVLNEGAIGDACESLRQIATKYNIVAGLDC